MNSLSQGRAVALMKAPYYSRALLSLIPVVVPTGTISDVAGRPVSGQGTLATTDDGILLVEKGALERMTPQELGAALIHETKHVLRRHAVQIGSRDPALANACFDLEINDDIQAMGFPVETWGWLLPSTFNLPNGKTWEWYYAQFQGRARPPRGHGPGDGACGSCAGNPTPNERAHIPPEVKGRSRGELAAMAAATAAQVREHASKHRGSIPSNVLRWATTFGQPPEVPWQEKLARACRRAVAFRPGAVSQTYKRPSRRQAGLGYGGAVLPAVHCPVPQVAVMIDTSGSMSSKELGAALRETDGIMHAVSAQVTLCVVDVAIHALREVTSVQQVLGLLRGGGGTDFREAFSALARRRPRPEVIVCLTDGWAAVPEAPLPGIRVIWALIGNNAHTPAAWGEAVRVT